MVKNQLPVKISEDISLVLFRPDQVSHIQLDQAACAKCQAKPCLHCCPAEMFTLSGDGQEVLYSHEGCLECGTCYVICRHLNWQYPKGGHGVTFREA